MFLAEPPRTPYDVNFAVAGVPVRVHPLFWLITLMMGGIDDPDPAKVLIWAVAVFVSILVHEMGHAVLIRYYGWRPRVILYAFGGLAAYEPTWHRTLPQIVISFAGPAAGFLLAAVVVVAVCLAGHRVQLSLADPFPLPIYFEVPFRDLFRSAKLNLFIVDMLFVNIFWGCLNLLPIYPLDGGKIANEVLTQFNLRDGFRQTLILSIVTAAGMAAIMFFRLDDGRTAIFFLIFAAMNYVELQQYDGRFGGRRW